MTDTTQPNGRTEQSEKPKGVQLPAEIELRDYFAASAMQGLLAGMWVRSTEQGFTENVDNLAACAYVAADALLSARKA